MLVKVCGMREEQNIIAVASLKPDYMGFIFYPGSKRFVGANFQLNFAMLNKAAIEPVAVFVNESLDTLLKIIDKFPFKVVQLHGNESPFYCKQLMDMGISVWKAFGINQGFDWKRIEKYNEVCRYFLFDTGSSNYGGTGQKFDWQLLKDKTFKKEFFLSGGIDAEDINNLIEFNHPMLAGIDINSKFELEPGVKDIRKINDFLLDLRNNI